MVAPTIKFRQFAVSGADPTGNRNNNTDDIFIKVVDTSSSGALDFGINNITNSGVNSATKVVVGALDTSGDMTTKIFNMRFWLPSVQAFDGTVRFNMQLSSGWLQDNVVDNSSADTTPTSLPTSGNLLRNDLHDAISGITDSEVSQFIYLSVFTDTDENVGVKGGGGQGTFRYRLTADYL